MKHVVGFAIALIIMVMIVLLNKYALTFEIPPFLSGWLSCTGYFTARDIYEEFHD